MTRSSLSRRVLVGLVAATLALTGLAGCSVVKATRDTDLALDRSGFTNARVSVSETNGAETVTVFANFAGTADISQTDKAAGVVWTTFPFRIDELSVDINGTGGDMPGDYTRGELETMFGPRRASLDRNTVTSSFIRTGRTVAIVIIVGFALFVIFLVVVVVLLVRRGRRRRASGPHGVPPPWGGVPAYGYGPQQGWQGGQPQPGWPPPPPGYGPPTQPPGWPGGPPPAPGQYGQPPPTPWYPPPPPPQPLYGQAPASEYGAPRAEDARPQPPQ